MKLEDLVVKLFADGAEIVTMLDLYKNPLIKGFTTNPTLMKKSGITDYRKFALEILQAIPDRPISFEVFSDELIEMKRQALAINAWAENVYVKIPITDSYGKFTFALIEDLAQQGVKQNVTALTTLEQVVKVSQVLGTNTPAYISVFAGRIADSGIDPVPLMAKAVELLKDRPNQELIWASPREVLNIIQADNIHCHIITLTNDILKKLDWIGRDLTEVSLATVKMFRNDAIEAEFVL
ncbi:transaldolase [Rickettsiella endosymbiont of Miltochrista miniata]|uniref:transaldolase n=1 Tax=Rickettsiella endosymbiont of Miltochrista miniata TaxID=3066239 RepID=UPI00313E4509